MPKKLSPWRRAYKKVLKRYNNNRETYMGGRMRYEPVTLDRGVNYFVEALERLGAFTRYSCDGHGNPENFYVMFTAPYSLALKIVAAGFFKVELNRRKNTFELRLGPAMDHVETGPNKYRPVRMTGKEYIRESWQQTLEWASEAWERTLFRDA